MNERIISCFASEMKIQKGNCVENGIKWKSIRYKTNGWTKERYMYIFFLLK